jgi:hypothetical protein
LSEATYGSVGKKYEKERGIPAEIINSLALITFEHPPKQA